MIQCFVRGLNIDVYFQNQTKLDTFGKIFPKLDFVLILIYNVIEVKLMIERTEYLELLKRFKDKDLIKVVTGIRRCGKSTLFEIYIDYLKSIGIEDNHIISVNLENPDNEFDTYKELYKYVKEQIKDKEQYYVFLDEVQKGHQAYIICPLVEANEELELQDVTSYVKKLEQYYGDRISVGLLHGKMRPAEKNKVMEAFVTGEIQVLVSTTVVEVGVNVPNATVMMIEDAQRFGLAQLHQLRGRVGRGEYQSYCIFMQGNGAKEISKRLQILNKSNDGFYIAGEDLKLRGPGDLFGIRQSGLLEFKLGDIYQDADILKAASETASEILSLDGDLSLPQNEELQRRLSAYMKEDLQNLGL